MIAQLTAAAGAGVTCASTTAINPDELLTLISSLDAAYLNRNTGFMMLRSTYTYILSLKGAGSGDYLFKPVFNADGRPTLLGYPVYFSPSCGALTAGLTPILFGDFSRFVRRQVRDSLVTRVLYEKFALIGQVGYLGFLRCDGGLLKASSGPIPVMAMTMHA
jgi:HK97 family phage major capsid protein